MRTIGLTFEKAAKPKPNTKNESAKPKEKVAKPNADNK